MSAVVVPAEAIFEFLKSKGFVPRDAMKVRGSEVVYERSHKVDTRFKVLVYTSVRRGATSARAIGKDAIRVVAIFEEGSTSRGICKLPRVHRTGTVEGVLARMLERMREAYARCCEARPKKPVSFAAMCADSAQRMGFTGTMTAHFDRVQQKHHPGSRPAGVERVLGDHYPEDDLEGDEP